MLRNVDIITSNSVPLSLLEDPVKTLLNRNNDYRH